MKKLLILLPILFLANCATYTNTFSTYEEPGIAGKPQSEKALIRTNNINIKQVDGVQTKALGRDYYYLKPGKRNLVLDFETVGATYGALYTPAAPSYPRISITANIQKGKVYAVKANQQLIPQLGRYTWKPELVDITDNNTLKRLNDLELGR